MSMKLGDLPADMKKSFRPYALGDHDDAEIDLKKLPVCTDKGIPVLAYPESSREKMKAFDANGDGYVEMYELERAAELYSESKNTSKRLMQLVAMLLAIIAVLPGVIAGCILRVCVCVRLPYEMSSRPEKRLAHWSSGQNGIKVIHVCSRGKEMRIGTDARARRYLPLG